ncbi:pentapeptide repeat-containing protein [Micromonospora sp. NPDC049900]|uniref:pentapeptide repeat-containing protein n=1 Tax=Micromonospora sp. NPDC049900 TaxID=3364275 RepID=UPI0037B8B3B5
MDDTSTAYREAVRRLTTTAPGARFAAAQALVALGATDPARRQPITDAICAWLRTAPAPDGHDAEERRTALRLLTDRLRGSGPAPRTPPWDGISVDLSGATLHDADFRACRLWAARFADTRFAGVTAFEGAAVDTDVSFARAVFADDTTFTGLRVGGDAAFGRTRFRGRTDFTGAVFAGMAWFGRGAETWWEEDEAWDTVDEITPAPWDEPNEDDPHWPVAVLIEDYQDWEEGGDGARFAGDVSFRDVRFDGPAWFHHARFGARASFAGARFAGRVHLAHPGSDLTGAHWAGGTDDGESEWPFGWAVVATGGPLTPDASVTPYSRQLADADPVVRAAGLRILARLGDDRPELRQPIVAAFCAFLRVPVPFPVDAEARTAGQDALLRERRLAQRLLADRLRPGPGQWRGVHLWLCGATLVDLDLRGGEAEYVDFTGAQFHGTTRLDGSRFDHVSFTLDGPSGRAVFHGDVVFGTAPPDHVVLHGAVA